MIKVKVTQDHIDNGRMGSCTKCAIAAALRDMGYDPWIEEDGFTYLDEGMEEIYRGFPREAIIFMDDFDSGRAVKPFEFTLTRRRLPMALDLNSPLGRSPESQKAALCENEKSV